MDAQQRKRLLEVEATNKLQNTALASVDLRLKAAEETNELQTAALASVENKLLTQTTERLTAVESKLAETNELLTQQTARLTAVETFIGNHAESGGTIGENGAWTELKEALTHLSAAVDAVSRKQATSPPHIWMAAVKRACSQICFRLRSASYVGSGWFYYDTTDDLQHGYFVTAAHCAMEVVDGVVHTMESGFIQDPTTGNWTKIDVSNVVYDGVADVALIKTRIVLDPSCCLRLAVGEQFAGDACYVVANPGGMDDDSVSAGCVRDPHYCEPGGYQITDSIFVTCPGMGGASGGPIVNDIGMVVGIYTFGSRTNETFGGGSNRDTLQRSLSALKTLLPLAPDAPVRNNRRKRYLGLEWHVPSPFLLSTYYQPDGLFRSCVYIDQISADSPFSPVLSEGDLLISATLPDGSVVEFGNTNDQRTPGVLVYYDTEITIEIVYIKASTNEQRATVTLSKAYADVSPSLDGPLQTGLVGRPSTLLLGSRKSLLER